MQTKPIICPPKYLLITAAGLGSRMKVVNNNLPKELLPILGKPAIQYAIEEGVAAGLTNIIVVINHQKDILRRYIEDINFRNTLFTDNSRGLTNTIEKCSFTFLYQDTVSGEIDAIRLAAPIIGDTPFAIIYPDDILYPFRKALSALCRAYLNTGHNIIGLSQVDSKIAPTVGNTGKVTLTGFKDDLYEILCFHPKGPGTFQLQSDSELRTCGIMVSLPNIFSYIDEIELAPGVEFTDGILRTHMLHRERFIGYRIPGRVYDIGNPTGYHNCIDELFFIKNNTTLSVG